MDERAYRVEDIKNVIDEFVVNGYKNKVFDEKTAKNITDYFSARGVETTPAEKLLEPHLRLTDKIAGYAKQKAESKLKAEAKRELQAAARGEEIPDMGAR